MSASAFFRGVGVLLFGREVGRVVFGVSSVEDIGVLRSVVVVVDEVGRVTVERELDVDFGV